MRDHVEAFGFILGVQRRTFRDQDPVNVEASASDRYRTRCAFLKVTSVSWG